MKPIHFVTIVLNGMPYIRWHLPEMMKLRRPWTWTVVHGVADPLADTGWCQRIETPPDDGTLDYLKDAAAPVRVITAERWPGKAAMCNAAVDALVGEPAGYLWQIDADECWRAEQWENGIRLLEAYPACDCAMFFCRYFVGPRRVVTQPDAFGNNRGEWLRLWKWAPGRRFVSHEPPRLDGNARALPPVFTAAAGLVFDHYAYADEAAVAFKERYYGYSGAVEKWKRLQLQAGPVNVAEFLPWAHIPAMSWEIDFKP